MSTKLLREARRMVADSGLPFELREATKGKPHHQFFHNGVLVFTLGHSDRGRDLDKLRSAIARCQP